MSKQVNYNENLCAGAAIRDDKGRRISKLFEASHPKMTVGYAKNLIMPDTPTEQEFNFRQSGGGVIEDGVAVIDKVKGNSVVWNQQCKVASGSFTTNNLSVVASEGGVLINGTASPTAILSSVTSCLTARIVGHKYLLKGCPSGGSNATYSFRYNSNGFGENGKGVIVTCVAAGTSVASDQILETYVPVICIANGVECNNLLFRPRLIDLTQMFGAGNEPTTYEEFLSRKPKVADEYAYNEGTIVNNKVEAVKVQGRNIATSDILLSTSLNKAKFANAFLHRGTYCISLDIPQSITLYVALFDKNGDNISGSASSLGEGWALNSSMAWWYRFIESGGKLSFSLAKDAIVSIKTSVTLSQTTRIMLNVGTTSLPYEPYEEHTLDLSWVKDIKDTEGMKLFEDGMRSAGTAFDEVRKNKAVKRIGVKVFDGTEGFINNYLAEYGSFVIMSNAFVGVGSSIGISTRYVVSSIWSSNPDRTKDDKQIYIDSINNRIWIRDSAFADVNSLKQYLADLYAAGTPLVVYYELAEPIEVEYDEKNLTYPVVAGGTEEAITSEPSTAFRADIGYGIDAVKTILDLKARVEALEAK